MARCKSLTDGSDVIDSNIRKSYILYGIKPDEFKTRNERIQLYNIAKISSIFLNKGSLGDMGSKNKID